MVGNTPSITFTILLVVQNVIPDIFHLLPFIHLIFVVQKISRFLYMQLNEVGPPPCMIIVWANLICASLTLTQYFNFPGFLNKKLFPLIRLNIFHRLMNIKSRIEKKQEY